jgi:hypothetical protein
VSLDAAEGLYRLVDAAYERRSVAVSSNLHPSGFDELMPKTLASATVDRLLHHAYVCVTTGDSVRQPAAGHDRKGGEATHLNLTAELWPPARDSTGHYRAILVAVSARFSMTVGTLSSTNQKAYTRDKREARLEPDHLWLRVRRAPRWEQLDLLRAPECQRRPKTDPLATAEN